MCSKIEWRVIRNAYQAKDYVYAITLSPKVGIDLEGGYASFTKYLESHNVSYWLVKCKSDNGFIHYHGVVHFSLVGSCTDIARMKLALRNKVNRCIGRLPASALVRPDSLIGWYCYIHNPNQNTILSEDIYHSPLSPNGNRILEDTPHPVRGVLKEPELLDSSDYDEHQLLSVRPIKKDRSGYISGECYE